MSNQRPDDAAEMYGFGPFGPTEAQAQRVARLITSSVAGRRWRELHPIDIARHLVANGVRVVVEVDNGRD